jgi:peptide/nickel transport system substrate-binding protein
MRCVVPAAFGGDPWPAWHSSWRDRGGNRPAGVKRRVLAALLWAGLASPAFAQPSTLTIGLREDPDVLDPTLGSAYVSRIVYASLCDKLIDIDAGLNLVPQLATAWEYEDPTHLVLHLRPGVVFNDGEPFNAEAVRYKVHRDATIKGSMRAGEVVDPLTVRLVLKAPSSPLLSQLADRAGIMISPKAAEAGDFGSYPVCAGPYAFESRVAQDSIVLRRFARHWDAANYHFDRIVFRPLPNSSVRLANLQAGSLDLVEYILPSDVEAVQRDPKLKIAIGDGLTYQGITFNTDNGPAADTALGRNRLVRQAFERAIDRIALNQVVYGGLFSPTAQANPESSPFFVPAVQPPPRDLERARALLNEAGVTPPVPVTLTLPNSPDVQQTAEVIQAMVAEAGFDLKLRVMEFASSLQAGYGGEFQAYLIGWSGRSDPDGNVWQQLHTGGTFNYGHWTSPAADALLDQARIPSDVAARRALYAKLWGVERADLPLLYLWTAKNVVGMKRGLAGFVQVPDGLIRLRGVTLAR